MNAIGQDHLNMIMTACTEAEKNWQALVVANPAENFSAGANLMMLMMEAAEGNWEDIDLIVRAFQAACGRLEHCGVPVVTAPAGLALGGGCEITLGGNAVRAAAETYIGLVEFGAGVIPAGGGCLRLYLRNLARLTDPRDLQPAFRRTFETIGTAKVATSAEEGRDLGFLRPRRHLVDAPRPRGRRREGARAGDGARRLRAAGRAHRPSPSWARPASRWPSPSSTTWSRAATPPRTTASSGVALAGVLSGGAVPPGSTITEQHMLDLEREALHAPDRRAARRSSAWRACMKTGKPLRN